MQQAAFDAADLPYDYVVERVSPGELTAVFPDLAERYAGLNVTRPLKEVVIPLLDEVSAGASIAGSVNTITFDADHQTVHGFSTDGEGMLAALAREYKGDIKSAVVIGTGGAARAIAAALAPASTVTVIGRNRTTGEQLMRDLGAAGCAITFVPAEADEAAQYRELLDGCDLLVNATPLGGPDYADQSPLPESVLPSPNTIVFDLISIPFSTPLLRDVAAAGCKVVHGIEMLIEQGALAFTLWTGLPAPVDVMRQAAYRAANIQPAPTVVG
jgi:shikimate dehydrogenase